MNINNLIKESHEIALEKGWYDCDECGGTGKIKSIVSIGPSEIEPCLICNSTGRKNRNISEMIALIIRELYEALEAHRSGKFANRLRFYVMEPSWNDDGYSKAYCFERHIKDTLEDECADVLIRLFDTMGYLGIEYDKDYAETLSVEYENTLSKNILMLNEMLIGLLKNDGLDDKWIDAYLHVRCIEFIQYFLFFCREQKIDIETHVNLKMEYNKTREYKHVKRY